MWDTPGRLLRLLSLLQLQRDWRGGELAQRLSVDVRTVRRDIERLRSLGYPVHSTPGVAGGYRLEPGTDLPPLLLDDDEAVAVAVGLRTAAGGSVSGIEESSQRALAKLERVLPGRLRGRVTALSATTVALASRHPVVESGDLAAIAAACHAHEVLRFDYRRTDGATARRTVEPFRLVHTGRLWYLVAWDVARRDWRTFRVDRIDGRPIAADRFVPRPPPTDDVAAYVSHGTAIAAYPVQARVTVHAPLDEVAQRISPTAGVVEAVDVRTCLVRTGGRTIENVAYHLVAMGLDFTVDDPPELAAHIGELAARLTRAGRGESPTTPDSGLHRVALGATSLSGADDLRGRVPGRHVLVPASGAEGATTPEPLRHQGPQGRGSSGDAPRAATEGERRHRRRGGATAERPILDPSEHHVSTSAEHFADRHIGPAPADVAHMLDALGLSSLDELLDQAVPSSIRDDKPLELDDALSEPEAIARLRALADRNEVVTSLIGQGYHDTHTPGVILRNVLENPAWYTAYTPYQPEISQGRLEALLNFQTMVCDLTGLEITNASMLDEGTAAAEAMTLARRSTKHPGNTFFVDAECHPQTVAVVATRAEPLGIDVVVGDPAADLSPADAFGVLLQHPGTSGVVRDLRPVIDAVHEAGGFATVATDLLACTLLVPPGELGADAAVGNTQRFGVPMGFGGPHAGFLATRDGFRRSLPGRLVGVSVDAAGRPAHRLALQTREQHIRREKATSNICTAQVLLAVMASMYAVYHGPDGLRAIAQRVANTATRLAAALTATGYELANDSWFDTLTLRTPGQAAELIDRARATGINLRRVDTDTVALSLDETTDAGVLRRLATVFGLEDEGMLDVPLSGRGTALAVLADGGAVLGLPEAEQRTSDFLTHPVFHEHRSETEMLRYLRHLADKDVALDRAMIPLGSCTMKLNATTEMEPVTWPEFGALHPFAPLDQAQGYLDLIHDLEATLAQITGYDTVSLQPNAGSQGELAGLLAIRGYHRSRGDDQRDVCLIPASAHGTNAASAVMAGMRVVVVACDDQGNVDLDDFRAKADQHGDRLAALMVTYPSTHGVFEEAITEICNIVHAHGGQVYVDGANLNALVGVARPGWFGGDVSHLNLHKTFCIPHGGGGPGVGPVAARSHLAPFLPNHPAAAEAGPDTGPGPVSAAPWGSASILPISYTYTKLMGPDGLRRATAVAILSANYVAARLGDHFPVLYAGENGRVAHECIIDIRPLTKQTGVTVDDVAKRLIDYGFHAPTMSFPVAGTLMIEPTESEPLAEIDRFCDAMIAIRGEIDRVATGEWPHADSPLAHAPHTAEDLLVAEWDRPYSREQAAYPVATLRRGKYWPPVSRIDGGYGDRNLVCACPPPESFEDATV